MNTNKTISESLAEFKWRWKEYNDSRNPTVEAWMEIAHVSIKIAFELLREKYPELPNYKEKHD